MELLMQQAGWTKKDFKLATELTSTEQSKALCDGKIDAYVYTVGVPNAGVAIATDGCGARSPTSTTLLPRAMSPPRSLTTPGRQFRRAPTRPTAGDVTTWGVKATFVTSADVPADVVYEVTRAVFENIGDFRKLHPAFRNLDPKVMVKDGLSAPLHPGAAKYYKEKGPDVGLEAGREGRKALPVPICSRDGCPRN